MKMKIKRLRDWGLFSKIIGLLIFSVTPLVLFLFLYILPSYEEHLFEEKRTATRQVVQVASGVIEKFQKLESSGELTTADAQQKALNELKEMRYNESDYFWINDTEPRMIMHPIKPALDGKDLSDMKDPNGIHRFVKKMDKALLIICGKNQAILCHSQKFHLCKWIKNGIGF